MLRKAYFSKICLPIWCDLWRGRKWFLSILLVWVQTLNWSCVLTREGYTTPVCDLSRLQYSIYVKLSLSHFGSLLFQRRPIFPITSSYFRVGRICFVLFCSTCIYLFNLCSASLYYVIGFHRYTCMSMLESHFEICLIGDTLQ